MQDALAGTQTSAMDSQWRHALLLAIPAAFVAFVSGALLDPLAHQSTPFDRVAYPALSAGMFVLELLLLRYRQATNAAVMAVVVGTGTFFLSKLIYLLFFLPTGASVQAEMTESFFWIPAIYLLSLFVPNLRAALAATTAFFIGVVVCSVLYSIGQTYTPRTYGVVFALIQLNLANLTLLTLTGVFLGYKDRLARAQARQETLHRLAHTDLLTGLPNRRTLDAELRRVTDSTEPVSMLFIDVDGFKLVNDTLGHSAGDAVLEDVAQRLAAFLNDGDLVARISGDEFAVLLQHTPPERAMVLAEHMLAQLSLPYSADTQVVRLTASIGVCAYPHDAQDGGTMLRHADAAMYHVKSSGKNGVRRFDPALDAQLEQRKRLERELQFALVREQLEVVYQPIFDLQSGAVVKVEALLRWTHPEFGVVSPAVFIPIAESSGQIVHIGAWALQSACRQARAWRDLGSETLKVTVNVSPLQFAQPNFTAQVRDALLRASLPASSLELELTEGALIYQQGSVQVTLGELQRLGVSISIDDFGTGYSSLSYLRDLPIDAVKIDQSFIADLATPRRAPQYTAALVEAIVTIARTLDLQVVAEGIETQTQLDLVRNLGCDHGQGYYFARPGPAAGVAALLQRDRPVPPRLSSMN